MISSLFCAGRFHTPALRSGPCALSPAMIAAVELHEVRLPSRGLGSRWASGLLRRYLMMVSAKNPLSPFRFDLTSSGFVGHGVLFPAGFPQAGSGTPLIVRL